MRFCRCYFGWGANNYERVFRIEDRCYASRAPGAKVYDCSLDNGTILAMEYPAPPPTPPPPATDAGEMACADR